MSIAVLSVPAVPLAQSATIPAAFHGRWEPLAKDCRDPNSVLKVTVAARKIDYLGQTQTVQSLRTVSPQVIELVVLTKFKDQDPGYEMPATRDKIRMSINSRGMMAFGDGSWPMTRCQG